MRLDIIESADDPTAIDPARLLARLRSWSERASADEIDALDPALRLLLPNPAPANGTALSATYDVGFKASEAYRATLPDIQNGPSSQISGTRRQIQHVGISNFRLPIRYLTRDGDPICVETAVTGTVSLEADKKGINMSRIMRTFYGHAEQTFSFDVIERALDDYKTDLDALDARIQLRFSYPMRLESLRSGLSGYQYYDIVLELIEVDNARRRIMHLDYVYSSTCPCSLELSEHARRTRGQLATPHSQRSVARLSVELAKRDGTLWFEDLIDLCRRAVPTETQVMVKREDEQAFAELNAANPIFVEDAARLFARELQAAPLVGDFRIAASHQESLHSHDAVSILVEGETFRQSSIDTRLFETLIHAR